MVLYLSNIAVNDNGSVVERPIGGEQFDGGWESYQVALAAAGTLAAGASATYDISSHIPNDGYDYECLFDAHGETNGTTGANLQLRVEQGTSASGTSRLVLYRINPSGGAVRDGKQFTIPILASREKKVTVYNSASQATGNFRVFLRARRRMGNNYSLTNPIEKVTIPESGAPVGENELLVTGNGINDSEWVSSYITLLNGVTMAPRDSRTIDVSSYLPADGGDYECLVRVYGETGNVAGNWTELTVSNGSTLSEMGRITTYIARATTRTASVVRLGGNAIIPVAENREIVLSNYSGAVGNTKVSFQLLGYKRLAMPATGNYISKINNNFFGGDHFSGRWTYKRSTLMSNVTLNNTTSTTRTYTLSNYLPDSENQYEMLAELVCRTPATANTHTNITYTCGATGNLVGAYNSTREARQQGSTTAGILVGKQVNGVLTVSVSNNNNSYSSNTYLLLYGYRRVGTAGNIQVI